MAPNVAIRLKYRNVWKKFIRWKGIGSMKDEKRMEGASASTRPLPESKAKTDRPRAEGHLPRRGVQASGPSRDE